MQLVDVFKMIKKKMCEWLCVLLKTSKYCNSTKAVQDDKEETT